MHLHLSPEREKKNIAWKFLRHLWDKPPPPKKILRLSELGAHWIIDHSIFGLLWLMSWVILFLSVKLKNTHTHTHRAVPPTPPLTWKHPAELNTLQPFRCLTRKLTEMDKSLFQSHFCVGIPDKCSPNTGHGAECRSGTYSFIQFWPAASSCWPTAGLKVRSPPSLSLSEGAKCGSSSLLSQQNNILFLCLTLLSFRFQPQ